MNRLILPGTMLLLCGGVLSGALLMTKSAPARPAKPLPVLRWSDAHTWKSGRIPGVGEKAVLPEGRTVLLDIDPPSLQLVSISGTGTTLIFDDSADRKLSADEITVSGTGARLVIGTEAHPFQHRAMIRLTGADEGDAMLAVMGKDARLEIHGEPRRTGWTHLNQTSRAGSNTLILAEPKNGWHVGDAIVIAPTGFDPSEAETRTIRAVNGATITLDAPLRYTHWGTVLTQGIKEQAEVGLLSRNIVVEGEKERGGCVMMMGTGAGAQIEGAEFRHLGRQGEKGKYPVHFHLVGNATGSYVRDSSLHNCYNRWLTIHGTRHVVAENNVGFDTIGHGYFLEDGNETDNSLVGNLGIQVHMPLPGKEVTPGDIRPAVFWVSNPDNIVRGNVAAGSDYYGFWYDLPIHPTGVAAQAADSYTRNLRPRRTPLGEFSGNTSHSCEHDGLFVDNAKNPPGVVGPPTYDPTEPAFFRDYVAYKCRRRGAWLRGSRLFLTGARLADNGIGATLAASDSALTDAVIVGETENRTGLFKPDEPSNPLVGFEFYDGPLQIENVTFAEFDSQRHRPASALGVLRFSPFFVAPLNTTRRLRFVNSTIFYWERRTTTGDPDMSGDGYRTAIFTDGDGSVTGKAGARVVAGEPLLYAGTDACALTRKWHAAVCDGEKARFARLFIDNRDTEPAEIGPIKLSSRNRPGDAVRMWGVPRAGANVSFQANVRTNEEYIVENGTANRSKQLRLTLRDTTRAGDLVTVTVPSGYRDESVSVYSVDAHKTQTPIAIDGNTIRRNERAGTITIRLVTPEPGEKTTVLIVRDEAPKDKATVAANN